jgi:hypothetical protein
MGITSGKYAYGVPGSHTELLNPKQNGGRSKTQLIDHMANDDLVGWAWHPGDGRTLPPMSRPAFAAQVRLWIAKGAYAPDAKIK